MTKKDFELIAKALQNSAFLPRGYSTEADTAYKAQHRHTCERMADVLANTNPRFDHARFLAACGYSTSA